MRYTALAFTLALTACSSSTESFTVNGEDVTRAAFEELTGGGTLVSGSDDPTTFALSTLSDTIDASGLTSRSGSTFAAINAATGEATFTGVLDIATRGVPGREYNILTQADIVADFDADTLSTTFGEATVVNRDNDVVASPTNNLVASNGVIGGDRANAVAMDISGSLDAQNISIIVQGNLEGSFRGTPIAGLTATDNAPVVIINGGASPSASITLRALAD